MQSSPSRYSTTLVSMQLLRGSADMAVLVCNAWCVGAETARAGVSDGLGGKQSHFYLLAVIPATWKSNEAGEGTRK